jgi:hypothetical protein
LASLGAASVGLLLYGARRFAARAAVAPSHARKPNALSRAPREHARLTGVARLLPIDSAERLQLRQMSRNAKRPPANAMRPALRAWAPTAYPLRASRARHI